MHHSSKQKSWVRIEQLSNILDSSIPIGKSGYRIGIDPLIGLIPGIGDPLSALIGSYIIIESARLGASRFTLGKMMINLALDTLLGAVPFLGDIFDFTFKANQRNLMLLKEAPLGYEPNPTKRLTSTFALTLFVLLIFIALICSVVLFSTFRLLGWLLGQAAV